jgi:hypothetical protein
MMMIIITICLHVQKDLVICSVNVNFISILFACLNQVADSGNAALSLPLKIIMWKRNTGIRSTNSITLGERREDAMIDSMCTHHPQMENYCHVTCQSEMTSTDICCYKVIIRHKQTDIRSFDGIHVD